MITLEQMTEKVKIEFSKPENVARAMPIYADLRGISLDELKERLESSETEIDTFYKFFANSIIAIVCEKAEKLNT